MNFVGPLLLGLLALVYGCPKGQAPALDTGPAAGAETAAAETATAPPAAPECPEVQRSELSSPKGRSASLRIVASAPGRKGRPAVILLHSPEDAEGGSGFPVGFVDELRARALSVVEVSGLGEGESGVEDVRAVRKLALREACAPDPERVAFIASPKTGALALALATSTTAEDRPAALVLLSGGEATEARTKVRDHRAQLETLPMLFVYSDRDAAWSTQFQDEPTSPLWLFRRQGSQAHGLELLAEAADSADDIAVFLEGFLQ